RAKIAELIGSSKSLPLFEPRYNIAPSQPVLAVRIEPGRGEREGTMLKWGLIPSWAKEPGIGDKLANARADTVAETPAFRCAFNKYRCLAIDDLLYEVMCIFPSPSGRLNPGGVDRIPAHRGVAVMSHPTGLASRVTARAAIGRRIRPGFL